MSYCEFDIEPYRIACMAEQIKDRFLTHRDRRLKNVFVELSGKRREDRHSCSCAMLKILRDAYRAMRIAQVYAECLESGRLCEMDAEDVQARLSEGLEALGRDELSLRRVKPSSDEEPEEAAYRETSEGVWVSDSEEASQDTLEKLNYGYHEPSGVEGRRCATCLAFNERCYRCDHIRGCVSRNGVCRCWTDPKASLCLTCKHGGAFDGRMTKCLLDSSGSRFTRQCDSYIKKSGLKKGHGRSA